MSNIYIMGIPMIMMGIFCLCYSVLYRNRIRSYKMDKMIIINKEQFLKLQLILSVIISVYLMVFGLIDTIYHLRPFHFLIVITFLYCAINLLIALSKKKGYIKQK
jgi:hypothetical protein